MDERGATTRAEWERVQTQDRRLGSRYTTAPISIRWRVEDAKGLRRRTRFEAGELVDLSLTGAGIVAPPDDVLSKRNSVRIEWNGARAIVEIRHIGAGPLPGTSYYGVLFRDMEPTFSRQLDEHIATRRPSSVEALRPSEDL